MIIGKEGLEDFYKYHEDPWYFSWRAFQQLRYEQYLKMLLPYVNKDSTLLDIGCGKGYFSKKLLDTGFFSSIIGIDISEEAIKQAQQLYGLNEKLAFQAQALPQLDFKNKEFDVIAALEVIYYLQSPSERILAFLNIYNLVKKEGLFLVSVNIGKDCFYEKELFDSLHQAGFFIEKIEYIRDSFYVRQERNLCWVYDWLKEMKERAHFTYPLFFLLEIFVKALLHSKFIAKIGLFLTHFSKKEPNMMFVLARK